MVRIDLGAGTCDGLAALDEIARRRVVAIPSVPQSGAPWKELYRKKAGQLAEGDVLDFA